MKESTKILELRGHTFGEWIAIDDGKNAIFSMDKSVRISNFITKANSLLNPCGILIQIPIDGSSATMWTVQMEIGNDLMGLRVQKQVKKYLAYN